MTTNSCPHCGKPVPPEAPGGLCPECMLNVGASPATGPLEPDGTMPSREPAPSLPLEDIATLFPHLEILDCLGRGGMGAVYKARQPKLDRIVAVKILLPDTGLDGQDPGFTERFEREARTLAKLNHPNIVGVYDFGETNGYLFLVMEYVEGLNLRQMIHGQRLKSDEALAIVPRICEALQYAHEQGIIHRDIKPENILIDQAGTVKIADFGIAKILGNRPGEDALTQEHHVIGTPHYMAPEQVEQPLSVDHRADIYSLGVVFYEMLTGELPLGKFAPPSRKVNVDVRLDEVVLHTLEKEPGRRYQHVSDVKTDVEGISGSPNAGRPAPPDHLSDKQKALLRYGFAGCLIGLPAGLVMSLPLVTVLSVLGLVVSTLKWTDRWPFPSLLSDQPATPRPPPSPADDSLTEAQMIVLYIGFACCVMGLGAASLPHSPPLFRVFLTVLSLIGVGTIVPSIVLRRRLFVLPRGRHSEAVGANRPARPGRGPLYWILVLFAGGFGLLVLISILSILLSIAIPALLRSQTPERGAARVQPVPAVEPVRAQGREQEPVAPVSPGGDGLAREPDGGDSEDALPSMTGPDQQTPPDPKPPVFTISEFGPMQEITLAGEGDETMRLFDLDTGRAHTDAESSPEEMASWRRSQGIDLVADTSTTPGILTGFDLIAIPVNEKDWDIEAPRLAGLLMGASPRATSAMQANPDASPATYVFQTREGSIGVLQIIQVNTQADPPTISLRYRLSDARKS